jgi:hypothetical protein
MICIMVHTLGQDDHEYEEEDTCMVSGGGYMHTLGQAVPEPAFDSCVDVREERAGT